jgi:molybdate transport system ATP-binding protein
MQPVIYIKDGVPRHPLYRMKQPVNLSIYKGEQIAIVGPNGAGKSRLIDIMIGRWPLLMNDVEYDFTPSTSSLVSDNIKYITFRDSYGDSDTNLYYQQRWNSQDLEITPLVRDLLPVIHDSHLTERLYSLFGVEEMLDKHIVLLSSGEMRKFQIVKTLLANPRILIMDNPFIGLDADTRTLLKNLFSQLINQFSLQLVLVVSKPNDIPDFITHVIPVEDLICGEKTTRLEYLSSCHQEPLCILSKEKILRILELENKHEKLDTDDIVQLDTVSIRYGNRCILNNLDWTIKKGEKWALRGENGAGKSTILSLICADNPQSYTCNINLFGKKRGTGESIWDIKKRIGYVSPEMFRSYLKNLPVIDIVASGLFDTVGLYRRPKPEQLIMCEWWLDIFGISHLQGRNFLQLSSGEQRLVLLARAFVKDPDLLILDEPLHGLDNYQCRLVKDIIEVFCQRMDKTLIMVTHYPEELPSCITNTLHIRKN